ncbi:hypothetical protein CVT26_002164 [Gymnopilus dilepis]|uniref:Uncharacterized protein n=1 Tax=Gymnopilus dilepis TaxID=231916 RepID=A0A409VBE3_9AGAR|nr:hypothetical protein CVT26_002164 [Gymnopilus dilepis]
MSALTLEDIHAVARVTISLLSECGIVSCLVGSAAGSEHGISRVPNDVDILALAHDLKQQDMKDLLVQKDSRFSLEKPASNPNASYFVLRYCISGPSEKFCHVDVFLPGMIHLPYIPPDRIVHSPSTGLPVMPFFPVLLHKIQAWLTHRASPKEHARIKQVNDVQDIQELLDIAMASDKVKLEDHLWLPQWFREEAVESIPQFTAAYPETSDSWKGIGFSNNNQ